MIASGTLEISSGRTELKQTASGWVCRLVSFKKKKKITKDKNELTFEHPCLRPTFCVKPPKNLNELNVINIFAAIIWNNIVNTIQSWPPLPSPVLVLDRWNKPSIIEQGESRTSVCVSSHTHTQLWHNDNQLKLPLLLSFNWNWITEFYLPPLQLRT